MLLNFILAESALEVVPERIRGMPAVVADSRRRGKAPSEILLDRSFHHSAMRSLQDGERRGRPDLVHQALLNITGAPLYLDGRVRVFVHAYGDVVLELKEGTRIPKNYIRFRGLMEKALIERPREGLVKVFLSSMEGLLRAVSADAVFGLSVRGEQMKLDELAKRIVAAKNPCLVVGGFPHGHFSRETARALDHLVRIDARPLEAQVVVSRVVYEVEKVSGSAND